MAGECKPVVIKDRWTPSSSYARLNDLSQLITEYEMVFQMAGHQQMAESAK